MKRAWPYLWRSVAMVGLLESTIRRAWEHNVAWTVLDATAVGLGLFAAVLFYVEDLQRKGAKVVKRFTTAQVARAHKVPEYIVDGSGRWKVWQRLTRRQWWWQR